jgi:hypothetical protein
MNPQLLQLMISVAGIALMVGLCRALFGAAVAPLTEAVLAQSLSNDVPGFRAGSMALSGDAHFALIEDGRSGAIYLAVMRGDGVVTRKLGRDFDVSRNGSRLDFRLRDFTLDRARFDIADAHAWEEKLKGLAA